MPNLNRDENTHSNLKFYGISEELLKILIQTFKTPFFFSTLIIYFHVDWYAITLFMIWH